MGWICLKEENSKGVDTRRFTYQLPGGHCIAAKLKKNIYLGASGHQPFSAIIP